MKKAIPTDGQRLIDAYISRELFRPKPTCKTPVLIFALMLVLPLLAGVMLKAFVPSLGFGTQLLICYLTVDLLLLRLFLIKLVRCYQHYAKEELRRFCMCVPSCSEYAVAVLKKYPLPVAVYKTVKRLTKTCDGEKKIDMP